MNTSKTIRGAVNSHGFTITPPITQWDYGYMFLPEIEDLPATYRLDFSNEEHSGSALPVYGGENGAEVPEELIDTGRDIFVWYFFVGDGYGKSAYKWRIPNRCKPKTSEDEPTPSQQSSIDQLITRSNEAVESAEQSARDADQSARSASDDADRAERARTGAETAQGKAEKAQESAERAKDDAETSERNASESERKAKGYSETASEKADSIHSMTASAQALPAGSSASASYNAETGVMSFGIPKGKDGTDGDDGYSPTTNVSKTGKVATITITDKNGTTTAQVEDGIDGIDGISPSVSVTDITGGHRVVITDKDGTKSFDVEDGATGATPNLTIGTVETLEPTESATATITGTPENPVLNLGIPQGDAGEVTLDEFYKAFPTDTASGSIASFSDGADNLPLKSLVVDINPVQDLHGQDAPYPAGGGKNKFDVDAWIALGRNNIYYSVSDGAVSVIADDVGGLSDRFIQLAPNTQYTISFKNATSGRVFDDTAVTLVQFSNSQTSATFTTTESGQVAIKFYSTTYPHVVGKVQIELGSTATAYAPYENICPISGWTEVDVNHSDADMTNPTTITINLGQTVYGGKLDVLSGELTIDRAMVVYDGSSDETWERHSSGSASAFAMKISFVHAFVSSNANIISNYLTVISSSATWGNFDNWVSSSRGGALNTGIKSITDVETWRTYLASNPLEVCYTLATPLTIQLTPNQVNSLLGVNNIWADSGDTEVVYRADTKLFIERLTAPDSADMVADSNITSGQYFMVGNSLYKATANIANGSAIIVGTNCIRKSLSEALNEINA